MPHFVDYEDPAVRLNERTASVRRERGLFDSSGHLWRPQIPR
jgi:hypothetical protein